MKCFSLVFTLIFSLSAFSAVFKLSPKERSKISPGDRVPIKISAETAGATIPDVEGKRIAGIFYIMDQNGDTLEAIVAPPQKVESLKPLKGHKFIAVGFKYQHEQTPPMREFLVEDANYSRPFGLEWWMWLLGVLAVALGGYVYRWGKSEKAKKARKRAIHAKLNQVLKLVENAEDRRQIEKIYEHKNDLMECFEYEGKAFDKFFKVLSDIMYKPSWTSKEEKALRSALKKFRTDLRIKRGI